MIDVCCVGYRAVTNIARLGTSSDVVQAAGEAAAKELLLDGTSAEQVRVVSKNSPHSDRPGALDSCGLRLSFGRVVWPCPHITM